MSHGSITAAACGGSAGAIRMLLKCGALKNATDAYGKRALHTLQKSPIYPPKEPYIPSKRALYTLQKSPAYPPKEPYTF